MTPIKFEESNVVIAEDQPEYLPLPAYVDDEETITCWQLTWKERFKIFFTGILWFRQMNFGRSLQPQLPTVDRPFAQTIRRKD